MLRALSKPVGSCVWGHISDACMCGSASVLRLHPMYWISGDNVNLGSMIIAEKFGNHGFTFEEMSSE